MLNNQWWVRSLEYLELNLFVLEECRECYFCLENNPFVRDTDHEEDASMKKLLHDNLSESWDLSLMTDGIQKLNRV